MVPLPDLLTVAEISNMHGTQKPHTLLPPPRSPSRRNACLAPYSCLNHGISHLLVLPLSGARRASILAILSPHQAMHNLPLHATCSIAILLATSTLLSCGKDEETPSVLVPTRPPADAPDAGPDLATQDMREGPPPTRHDLCAPGARRCLTEHSPLAQSCSPDGLSWRDDPCPDQSICEDGACVPFACVPDRPICLGATTRATCSPSGRSVRDVSPCAPPLSCLAGACVDRCALASANGSYTSCDFIATSLDNISSTIPQSSDSPYAVIAANPHPVLPTTISMTSPQGLSTPRIQSRTLTPSTSYSFGKRTTVSSEILRPDGSAVPISSMLSEVTLQPGEAAALLVDTRQPGPYLLHSTQPIVAYQFNPYCCNFTASNDASLLLPTNTLGSTYRVINYPSMYIPPGDLLTPYITLIATTSDTSVTIDSPAPILLKDSSTVAPTRELFTAKTRHTFTLNRGELATFEIPSNDLSYYQQNLSDLSGALVSSSAPVALFSGHPCTFVPQDSWACDHLEEQLFPAETLGKRYILNTIAARNKNASTNQREGIYWRIVAHEDAIITTSPALNTLRTLDTSTFATKSCVESLNDAGDTLTLRAGEVCEIGLTQPLALDSNAPLLIAGVISGHQSTGLTKYGTQAGDPAMFLLPPLRQFRRDYSFVTSPTFKKTFAAIIAPAATQFSYQGSSLSPDRIHSSSSVSLLDARWEIFSVDLDSGLHTIEASAPFGMIVYAYDDYVSYAFPAGLDLANATKE